MLTYLRYTLATVCFAASVGCLALWWRSISTIDEWTIRAPGPRLGSCIDGASYLGYMALGAQPLSNNDSNLRWRFESHPVTPGHVVTFGAEVASGGRFRVIENRVVYFPLWYPALIFALAGVAALRFRRQFSIRSALVCLTVVAALLGMAVAL